MSEERRPYTHPIGVSVGDMTPPEALGEKARWLEQLGYSHIMVPEDYFYVPALVGATLALSATREVPVGTSIDDLVAAVGGATGLAVVKTLGAHGRLVHAER